MVHGDILKKVLEEVDHRLGCVDPHKGFTLTTPKLQ
jgi:hypothetical protein